mmetsp:Transcript_31894/g.80590  ORF Transcript_31894/g.80590 Transcript_31894/m.80590 type:complete len:249 (-) Transcript_31894:826-1572(-)
MFPWHVPGATRSAPPPQQELSKGDGANLVAVQLRNCLAELVRVERHAQVRHERSQLATRDGALSLLVIVGKPLRHLLLARLPVGALLRQNAGRLLGAGHAERDLERLVRVCLLQLLALQALDELGLKLGHFGELLLLLRARLHLLLQPLLVLQARFAHLLLLQLGQLLLLEHLALLHLLLLLQCRAPRHEAVLRQLALNLGALVLHLRRNLQLLAQQPLLVLLLHAEALVLQVQVCLPLRLYLIQLRL